MKYKILSKIIFFSIIALLMIPNNAFALKAYYGGNPGSSGRCAAKYEYCYHDENEVGIRLSLYTYDGTTLESKGVADFQVQGSNIRNFKALTTRDMQGKLWYQYSGALPKVPVWKNYSATNVKVLSSAKSPVRSSNFKEYYNNESVTSLDILKTVKDMFSLDSENTTSIINSINSTFGSNLTNADAKNVYITAEPTMLFHSTVSASSTEPEDYYYGTVYEMHASLNLFKSFGSYSFYGLAGEAFYNLPMVLNTSTLMGSGDTKKFVTTDTGGGLVYKTNGKLPYTYKYTGSDPICLPTLMGGKNQLLCGIAIGGTARLANKALIIGKYGYGLQVYWIGEYASQTCTSECGGFSGDNYLRCAEKFCESESGGNATAKKTCMTAGGDNCHANYTPISCSGLTCATANTSTNCSESKSVDKKTCKMPDESDGYIKIQCTDFSGNRNKVTYSYSNDLPTSLISGIGGFNYSVNFDTNRYCTATFDYNKAKYEYAYRLQSQKSSFLSYLNGIINNNYKTIYSADNYEDYWKASKIDMSGTSIDFTVGIGDSGSLTYSYNDSLPDGSKAFIRSNPTPDTIAKSQASNTNFKLFNSNSTVSGASNSISFPSSITLDTSSSSVYQLKGRCYTLKNGRVDKILASECRDIKESPFYYGFNSTKTKARVDTRTVLRNNTLCISDTNSCYYTNEEQIASCYTKTEKVGSQYKISFGIDGYQENSSVISDFRYCFGASNDSASCPGGTANVYGPGVVISPKTYSTSSTAVKKYAWLTYTVNGVSKKTYCNYYIPKTDLNGTCKGYRFPSGQTFTCEQAQMVEKYCQENWMTKENRALGYKSATDCIKDCSCIPILTTSKEYIYRPIALGETASGEINAFPNREAGYNWKGYEEIAARNLTSEGPIYTIKLDKNAIRTIREDTAKQKSKYLDYNTTYDGSDGDNCYTSSLVRNHVTDGIFTIESGKGVCN